MSMVPNFRIQFSVDGEERELGFGTVTFKTWELLKRTLGFTPVGLFEALGKFDVEAVGAAVWLERRQTQPALPWSAVRKDLDNAEVELLDVLSPDDQTEEAEAEPDPTTAGNS